MLSISKQCNLFSRNNIIHKILNQSSRFPPIICQHYPMATQSDCCKGGGGGSGGGSVGRGGGSGCDGGGSGGGSSGSYKITYKPYVATCYKDHDLKNMTLKRPMSPHLTIHTPTLPAMTSILQRITGATLATFALLLASGTLFLSNGIDTYVSMIQSLDLSRPSIFFIKLILGFPFSYHYFCGIRYCAFNAGKWLQLKEVYDTGYKCLIASSISSFIWALL